MNTQKESNAPLAGDELVHTKVRMMEAAVKQKPKIAGDRLNVSLLMHLYTLQNIPRAMSNAIQFLLQSRDISYSDQAEFSFTLYPTCFKLLWAPIVDCVYLRTVGRRKSWAIPMQYAIGICLFVISMNINQWLGSEDGSIKPQIHLLTVTYFSCIFLCTMLEISVDGWALTMLKKRNIGHAGTCNNTGYVLGQFLGFVLFILLVSEKFCNRFRSVAQDRGFLTPADFIFFWSVLCMVSGTLLIFRRDNSLDAFVDEYECTLTLKESYKRLWDILKIEPVREMCLVLFTYQMGLGPLNGVVNLKLIDAGVPSDTLVLMTIPAIPFIMTIPFLLSNYLTGARSMRAYFVMYELKLAIGALLPVFIYFTHRVKDEVGVLPAWHYALLMLICSFDSVVDHLMYVTIYAFFSRVSDPRFGGTYVTLLFALSNIGYTWPISFCLWLVEFLPIKSCVTDPITNAIQCSVIVDGYSVEAAIFTLVGIIWIWWSRQRIYRLEDMDTSEWLVKQKPTILERSS